MSSNTIFYAKRGKASIVEFEVESETFWLGNAPQSNKGERGEDEAREACDHSGKKKTQKQL